VKRGPKPKGSVKIKWSPNFSYAIGLLTADGCLSKDGRHIDFTSVDKAQVLLFKKCLKIQTKIGKKSSGKGDLAYRVQFGDVLFYQFLMGIGLSPAKSKTLSSLHIPKKYFADFLRGYFDGDGCSFSFYDSIFEKSYRFYISFASASPKFINWLRKRLKETIGINGHVSSSRHVSYIQLRYAKKESLQICK